MARLESMRDFDSFMLHRTFSLKSHRPATSSFLITCTIERKESSSTDQQVLAASEYQTVTQSIADSLASQFL